MADPSSPRDYALWPSRFQPPDDCGDEIECWDCEYLDEGKDGDKTPYCWQLCRHLGSDDFPRPDDCPLPLE